MLQGSLMVDSTDFRTRGNENAASIIQSVERKDTTCQLSNELHPKRPNVLLQSPVSGLCCGQKIKRWLNCSGLLRRQAAQKGSQRGRR
jgi:hypothetical protein